MSAMSASRGTLGAPTASRAGGASTGLPSWVQRAVKERAPTLRGSTLHAQVPSFCASTLTTTKSVVPEASASGVGAAPAGAR